MSRSATTSRQQASEKNLNKMWKFARNSRIRAVVPASAEEITEFLVIGWPSTSTITRPLCPCNFYEDKAEEVKESTWICPCEEMQRWKYCH